MKKKGFLLLETLIALSIIMTCTTALVTYPLKIYRKSIQSLIQMEKERLADFSFSEIKEQFFKNEIPLEKIPELTHSSDPFHLSNAKIELPGCLSKSIQRTFVIKTVQEKIDQTKKFRLLKLTLNLDDTKYTFRLPILIQRPAIFIEK